MQLQCITAVAMAVLVVVMVLVVRTQVSDWSSIIDNVASLTILGGHPTRWWETVWWWWLQPGLQMDLAGIGCHA